MEAAVATVFLTKIAPKLFTFLQEKHEVRRSLERDIQYIRKEFRMIAAAIQDHDRLRRSDDGDVQRVWIQLVRDLAYSIEDCVDRFAHRVTPPKTDDASTSWLRQTVHGMKTVRSRQKFAAAIRELRKISEEASRLRACYVSSGGGGGGQSSTASWESASAPTLSSSETHTLAAELVGMDAPRDELLELISETEGQPEQLKVTSIVGFGGIGKTILAREVYDTVAAAAEAAGCDRQHKPRAWVRVAEKGPGDVLKDILQELGMPMPAGSTCDVNKLSTSIRECLGSRRFFIVIDDMRKEFWNIIKNAFPVVPGVSSRVIVTTAVRSIANACSSSAHGHVYVMRTLDEEHSRKLFFREASMEDDHLSSDDANELGSETLKKCDGLPLALITTAQLLQSRGNPTRTEWAKLCDSMGELLETKDTMARMNRVLVHSYASLPDHAAKACLLYLGIYPAGRPVRTGSLMRRWSAEGFVEQAGVAADKFRELLDRSILQPVAVKNNAEVRACRTHGMMFEFILRKSVGESFVTLLRDQAQARIPSGKIRWLSLQNYSGSPNGDLSLVRSLTVFGKASKSVLGFSKYELLRVLDLGECDDDNLEDSHVLEMCNLSLLRYLRLGGGNNITVLPKEISRLKHLETLDVRRTKIKILPIQVIRMPSLIHLFGVFKLDDISSGKMSKLQASLSEKSNLETLAGFVADESPGFPQIMEHMEHLTKVKIWCESTPNGGGGSGSSNNLAHLSKAIQGFLLRGTNVNDARSLSLSSENWSQDMVNFSLENSCYLNSLKLHGGNIRSLPPFVTMLGGLTELCLSCPDQLINGDVLAAVSRVRFLHYLELVAGQLGSFEVEDGVLDSLRRLCIVVRSMADLGIRERALPRLESLRLLCEDLDGVRGVQIDRLGRLREVALHDGVREETKQEWRAAARSHPRRPRVLFVGAEEVDRIRMQMVRRSKAAGSSERRAAMSAPPLPLTTPVAAGVLQAQQINGRPEESNTAIARTAAGKTLARLTSGSKRTNETPAECLRERADDEEVALAGVHECDGGGDRGKKNHASKRPKQVSLLVRTEEVVDHQMLENPAAAAAAAAASPVVADVQTLRLNEGREHPAVVQKIARLARDFKRRRFF